MTDEVDLSTYIFTNAGATGRFGPTQAQIDAAYLGTSLEGAVTINTQGIQEWTVLSRVFQSRHGVGGVGTGGIGGNGVTCGDFFQGTSLKL